MVNVEEAKRCMNLMPEIAQMLGMEMGHLYTALMNGHAVTVRMTEDGLETQNGDVWHGNIAWEHFLLTGQASVVKGINHVEFLKKPIVNQSVQETYKGHVLLVCEKIISKNGDIVRTGYIDGQVRYGSARPTEEIMQILRDMVDR